MQFFSVRLSSFGVVFLLRIFGGAILLLKVSRLLLLLLLLFATKIKN